MADRRQAERRGRMAENLAALLLRLKGYSILERRVRSRRGEIDLVAQKGRTLVFVEVKTRARLDDALRAVRPANWARIAAAAETWASRRPRFRDHGHRYDLVAVQPWRIPVHVRDAWRPDFAPTVY